MKATYYPEDILFVANTIKGMDAGTKPDYVQFSTQNNSVWFRWDFEEADDQ